VGSALAVWKFDAETLAPSKLDPLTVMVPGLNVTGPPLLLVCPLCVIANVVPSYVYVPVPQTRCWGQVNVVPAYVGFKQLTIEAVLSARSCIEKTPVAPACAPLVKSADVKSQMPTTVVGVA
jgi:hypothetical protein